MVFCNDEIREEEMKVAEGHNPYFNRWFSAMYVEESIWVVYAVTILILIDGFLQLWILH